MERYHFWRTPDERPITRYGVGTGGSRRFPHLLSAWTMPEVARDGVVPDHVFNRKASEGLRQDLMFRHRAQDSNMMSTYMQSYHQSESYSRGAAVPSRPATASTSTAAVDHPGNQRPGTASTTLGRPASRTHRPGTSLSNIGNDRPQTSAGVGGPQGRFAKTGYAPIQRTMYAPAKNARKLIATPLPGNNTSLYGVSFRTPEPSAHTHKRHVRNNLFDVPSHMKMGLREYSGSMRGNGSSTRDRYA